MAQTAPLQSDKSAAQAERARIGKRIVLGIGLLALGLILWELRNIAPGWLAKSMTEGGWGDLMSGGAPPAAGGGTAPAAPPAAATPSR